MSLNSAILIGQSALTASQIGLQIAGNNLANSATPGYSRQRASFSPGASGAPTECTHGTKCPSRPRMSSTLRPMRVMMRMLATTYGESVSSTPMCAMCEPSGPML